MTTRRRPRARQKGVTLLEVLIAVLILAFGMLGLAGLQLSSLRNTQSSMERSMAVLASYSIVNAMRVDRTNAINNAFNLASDADPTEGSFAGNALTDWRARLTELLGPDATGAVACNGAACTVTVRWNDQRGTDGDSAQQIITEVQL